VPGTAGQRFVTEPAVCGDGDGSLLVWGARPQAGPAELRALRLPAGGRAGEGTSFRLLETRDVEPPIVRLGCNQRAALVVWTGTLSAADPMAPTPLYLGHLARGAERLSGPPLVLEKAEGDERAGIASDGDDFLVSWRNFDSAGRRRVVGQRVGGGGVPLDAGPFAIGNSNSGHRVNALWDGNSYLVFAVHTQDGNPFELRGRRVSRAGASVDPDWQPVASLAKPWSDTGNGSDGVLLEPGRAFIVYDQFADEDATGNVRVRGRFISSAPLESDGGVPDGGASDGGGAGGESGARPGAGCGCTQTGAPPASPAALLVLALLRRCRRRARA
jgi:uncharacterized protein (TIGR03382 family)